MTTTWHDRHIFKGFDSPSGGPINKSILIKPNQTKDHFLAWIRRMDFKRYQDMDSEDEATTSTAPRFSQWDIKCLLLKDIFTWLHSLTVDCSFVLDQDGSIRTLRCERIRGTFSPWQRLKCLSMVNFHLVTLQVARSSPRLEPHTHTHTPTEP